MLNYEGSCSRMYAKHIIYKPVNLQEKEAGTKSKIILYFLKTFAVVLQVLGSESFYHGALNIVLQT